MIYINNFSLDFVWDSSNAFDFLSFTSIQKFMISTFPDYWERNRCITWDSGIIVLFSGQEPSCVCCHVDNTTGFSMLFMWDTAHWLGSGCTICRLDSTMVTVSMVMIWFQGTSRLTVRVRNGSLVNLSVTEPPALTSMSNLQSREKNVEKKKQKKTICKIIDTDVLSMLLSRQCKITRSFNHICA